MQQTLQTLLAVLAAIQIGDIIIATILYFIYGRRFEYLLVIIMWLGMLSFFSMDALLGHFASIYHIYFSFIFTVITALAFGEILSRLYGVTYSWILYFVFAILCYSVSLGFALLGYKDFEILAVIVSLGITIPVFVTTIKVFFRKKKLYFLDKFFLLVVFFWGVHLLDYPFLRQKEELLFSIVGFSLALFLTYFSSVLIPVILNRHIYGELTEKLTEDLDEKTHKLKLAQEQIIARENLANLGTLSAGIAHEIKNPINIILNSSKVLSEIVEGNNLNPENLREVVDMIERNALRADTTIKGILSQSYEGNSQLSHICPTELLRSAYDLVYSTHKNVSVKAVFNFSEIPDFYGYEGELLRCFINVYENAFKAIEEKAKKLEYPMLIETSTSFQGDFLEVEIKDNGIGVKESLKEQIFRPFFTTRDNGEGTGLGLSMVKDIVKFHNGEIMVDSQEGEFTKVNIRLYGKLKKEEK